MMITVAGSTFDARAAARRASWRGGVARSFAEMEEADLDFWLAATSIERVRAVMLLMDELRSVAGDDGPPPRLRRSAGGVRRRGR
jgi:hypothetical protein